MTSNLATNLAIAQIEAHEYPSLDLDDFVQELLAAAVVDEWMNKPMAFVTDDELNREGS